MRRLFFNVLTDLSLVACVALVIMGGRSTQHRDEYRFTRNGRALALVSVDGRIVIDNFPQIIEFRERQERQEARLLGRYLDHGAHEIPPQNAARWRSIGALVPPPLVSNTLFYYWIGVLLAAVLPALRLARRFTRELQVYRQYRPKAKAHCWNCGYSLIGNVSGTCPECGAACKAADPAGASPAAGD